MDKKERKQERIKTVNTLFVEYHKMSVDNAVKAQRGLLLCHGGAITGIVMSQKLTLLAYAFYFGLGAILCVLSSGCAYVANWCYTESWGEYVHNRKQSTIDLLTNIGRVFHAVAVFLFVASVVTFCVGIMNLWEVLTVFP